MQFRNWKGIAELVGIVAIVASLMFVGFQLQQDRQFAQVESLIANQTTEIELTTLIEADRDIWLRGLRGEELSELDELTFEALSNAVFRRFADKNRIGYRVGLYGEESIRSYALFLYQHPGLRRKFDELVSGRALRDRAYGYSDESKFYPKLVSEHLRHLDETSPELPKEYYFPM